MGCTANTSFHHSKEKWYRKKLIHYSPLLQRATYLCRPSLNTRRNHLRTTVGVLRNSLWVGCYIRNRISSFFLKFSSSNRISPSLWKHEGIWGKKLTTQPPRYLTIRRVLLQGCRSIVGALRASTNQTHVKKKSLENRYDPNCPTHLTSGAEVALQYCRTTVDVLMAIRVPLSIEIISSSLLRLYINIVTSHH